MLAFSRRLFEGAKAIRAGGAWDRRTELSVGDVQGRTLGIVGLGLIGSEMTRKCVAAFGMQVLAYDPYVPAAKAAALGATMLTDLGELLARSDFVSLHCELNDETRGMIGEAELRAMQRHAFLINTSRGRVVQQEALERALTERWIAGAALDVFEDEPLAEGSTLFALDNLILTPHVAGLSGDALRDLANSAATQILAALAGERPPHLVNPQVWDAVRARRAGAA
jgi:D-3-phosphoglycerate dehydrogenase/microcystin synthetase protein McyI